MAQLDDASLSAQLAVRGVRHLRTAASAEIDEPLNADALITALASHPAPRFRQALIPLFLRQPGYADRVPTLSDTLPPPAAETLRHMYTAAVYLQRMWRGVLGIYLGEFPLLPDLFGECLYGLPDPAVKHGKAGLFALANHFETQTGLAWYSVYLKVISLFLHQLRLEELDYATQSG